MTPEIQQQQWHDDFELKMKEYNQRQVHWDKQHSYWLYAIFVGVVAIFITMIK